uniref:Uncharacterized protein n=1 Tax=Ascaris lumbricoides TaxID=6252 RepID=A0A0M3HKX1_ASCLU
MCCCIKSAICKNFLCIRNEKFTFAEINVNSFFTGYGCPHVDYWKRGYGCLCCRRRTSLSFFTKTFGSYCEGYDI